MVIVSLLCWPLLLYDHQSILVMAVWLSCNSNLSVTPVLSCWEFLLSASALVVLLCRHTAELSNHVCEHVGSGSVRRPLHLCSLRHHLALCRSHCRPALWPAVCFQRQRGESPLCVLWCVCLCSFVCLCRPTTANCVTNQATLFTPFSMWKEWGHRTLCAVYVTSHIWRKKELMHDVIGSLVDLLDQHFIQSFMLLHMWHIYGPYVHSFGLPCSESNMIWTVD